ncbi:MAG: 5-formyltetrahydrofolate cyclo-ligase [Clostridia bacterium]|nr:5-formyltetrahydrofolate cyclo-ligase [Clostridia bacterium]
MDIRSRKNELREYYSHKRKMLSSSEKEFLDEQIANRFLNMSAFKSSNQILFYSSTADEISTDLIFDCSLKLGKACFFPKCYEQSKMSFFRVYGKDELIPDYFNIKAPANEKEIYSPLPSDIIIVPAMSYDVKGFRLGYGKGFYDRFLPDFMGTKIGLCYSDFIAESLPRGRYDISVDIIVTEKKYISL